MGRNRSVTSIPFHEGHLGYVQNRAHAGAPLRDGGARLREHGLQARTIQLKLRYSDFVTVTRAHSVPRATQLDTELFDEIRALFQQNWKPGARVRLLGVHVSGWESGGEQLDLLGRRAA